MTKLKFEIGHFLVILVLLLLNVEGCGGQLLSSKFILKVKSQMAIPKEHVHITLLTPWIVYVGILGFQSIKIHNGRPCIMRNGEARVLEVMHRQTNRQTNRRTDIQVHYRQVMGIVFKSKTLFFCSDLLKIYIFNNLQLQGVHKCD